MEKIWLKKYDPGVPRSIDMSQYHSLVEVLNENFKNYSNETAYINGTGSITYRQVNHSSCALAHFLVSKCSLAKGDRVAIMMPNLLQYPVSIFAIHRAGLVVVNIYPMHQPEIIEQILKKSGAKCLIILNDLLETVENIIDNTDVKNVIVTQKDDLFSKINSFGLNFWHYFKSKKINSNIKCKKHHFNSALTIINCILFRQSNVVGSDIAFIQFKGMTEKSLRGVVLTHKNVLANSQQITLWTDTFFKRKFRGVIVSVPMSFMLSALTGCYIFFRVGGTHILITDPNNIQNLIDEIKHYPFSTIIGYSRFFKNLLKNENFKEIDFFYD